MDEGLTWEALGIIVGAILGVGGFLGSILVKHGSKLSVIKAVLDACSERLERTCEQNQKEHENFRTLLNGEANRQRENHKEHGDALHRHSHRMTVAETTLAAMAESQKGE